MKEELGIEAELVPGDRGIFDVVADGRMVFSKYAEERYPENAEIVAALADSATD